MNKRNTKWLAVVAMTVAVMAALFLAACAGGNSAESTSSSASSSEAAASSEATSSETTSSEATSSEATSSSAAASSDAAAPANEVIRLSTTTSVNDSGLLPYLQPTFEEKTGYKLEITSAGTGAAIKKGETGDADLLLVHAKASEEEFIDAGFGVERLPFMYNFFVIVGPEGDPAGVANCTTAAEAFTAIANSGSTFVSRGDDSGTNKKELQIWEDAGVTPEGQDWYVNVGDGMGATLTRAAEMEGYTLTDKGTYLSHEAKDALGILLAESDDMKNTYSLIAVSPEKWPDVNADGANAFIEWMLSDEAASLISEYGTEEYGEPLFYMM